jgi:hypothetical protein
VPQIAAPAFVIAAPAIILRNYGRSGLFLPAKERDDRRRGNYPGAVNARKTDCIRGHEFTVEYTIRAKDGMCQCWTCKRDRTRQKRLDKRLEMSYPTPLFSGRFCRITVLLLEPAFRHISTITHHIFKLQ